MPAMGAMAAVDPAVPGSAPWWRDREERRARRRPRADGLSVERIVDAALALVDAEGLDALTVRRLADDLGTGSASLYRHVASRDELLVLLVDHVLGEVDLPAADLADRAQVEHLAGELRRVLMAHANLVPALTAAPLLGPNALRGSELALAGLLRAGFAPSTAVPAYLALVDFVLGTVFFDTSSAGRDLTQATDDGRVAALPHEVVGAGLVLPSTDDVFRFGLTTFLDGLEHRFPPEPDTRSSIA